LKASSSAPEQRPMPEAFRKAQEAGDLIDISALAAR
jgi:hypothetical protein